MGQSSSHHQSNSKNTSSSSSADLSSYNTSSEMKLMVLGAPGVGKSSLVFRFITPTTTKKDDGEGDGDGQGEGGVDDFLLDPTIEDTYRKLHHVDGVQSFLEILDTAAMTEYTTFRDMYHRQCHGYIIMFSITDRSSFDQVPFIFTEMHNKKGIHDITTSSSQIPVVLVGSKTDLEKERTVTANEAKEYATSNQSMKYVEISSKNKVNVDVPFDELVRMVRSSSQLSAMATAFKKKATKVG
eukprot:TRINITY_DN7075_c0_g1_i1.p1 TRINITY_DN7075_c0_g1~~TRINITY_DN7075_c0_g1_i1.p1  ORF type:complete len:260 (-),score=53.59 TRINITY_DN7075_c0_g1_i1:27-749(-)